MSFCRGTGRKPRIKPPPPDQRPTAVFGGCLRQTGTRSEQTFAVIHCTGGDILIALASLILALGIAGDRRWPASRYWRVALTTILLGCTYTIFSEWLNVVVRGTWAYSERM